MPERMCVSVLSPREGVSAAFEVEYAQKYVARAGIMPTSVGGSPRKKPFTPGEGCSVFCGADVGMWWSGVGVSSLSCSHPSAYKLNSTTPTNPSHPMTTTNQQRTLGLEDLAGHLEGVGAAAHAHAGGLQLRLHHLDGAGDGRGHRAGEAWG